MARTRPHRPPFDARHEFVVVPPAGRSAMSIGGRLLLAGQQMDKALVSARRLHQMYEARLIAVAPGSKLPVARERRALAIGPPESAPPPPAPQSVEQPPASRPRAVPRRRLIRAA